LGKKPLAGVAGIFCLLMTGIFLQWFFLSF